MFLPKEDSDKTMILSQLNNCTCSEPCSPIHNKSVYSFHIPDVSNINPFHVSFRPTCVSTPRKSHHVSMPALIRKPKQMSSYKTGSLGNMKLHQDFKVRPFSILLFYFVFLFPLFNLFSFTVIFFKSSSLTKNNKKYYQMITNRVDTEKKGTGP